MAGRRLAICAPVPRYAGSRLIYRKAPCENFGRARKCHGVGGRWRIREALGICAACAAMDPGKPNSLTRS